LVEAWSGVFQTSAVFISAGKTKAVYRSVQDVPDALRTKLLKTTNGRNSATILIADRGGRQQIAKAMRNLPGVASHGSSDSWWSGDHNARLSTWLTPIRKNTILALLLFFVMALIVFVFNHFR
jgi:hypothetical protein